MHRWIAAMEAMHILADAMGDDLEHVAALRQGMLIAAFHTPLLRRVIIDDVPHIAHITPGFSCVPVRDMDNPLENDSATGELRVVLLEKEGLLSIERNMGPRQKDRAEQSDDDACTRAGREMMRTEDYCGQAGRQFASLLQMSIPCFGNAFAWAKEDTRRLDKFKYLEVVTRADKKDGKTPTYDIILRSS